MAFEMAGIWILCLGVIVAITIHILWNSIFSPAAREPPMISHTIPWLGHALSMGKGMTKYLVWIKSQYPNSAITTSKIGGMHLYSVLDLKLASQVYRRSRDFTFDPIMIMSIKAFGMKKHDLEIFSIGSKGVEQQPQYANDPRRINHGQHLLAVKHLASDKIFTLTDRFMEHLRAKLDQMFPLDQAESYEWQEREVCEMVKKLVGDASVYALFGSRIFDYWPDVSLWLWELDDYLIYLFGGIPRLLMPRPYQLLDIARKKLKKWQEDALAADADISDADQDPEWSPHWGLRMMRERHYLFQKGGLSAESQAGLQAGMLLAILGNTIPTVTWLLIQTLTNSSTLSRIRQEISSVTSAAHIDTTQLSQLPHHKSLLLETFRWATALPTVRIVATDTELGGYTLKKGNMLIMHARNWQMDPETWSVPGHPPPDVFCAERFLETRDEDNYQERVRADEARDAEADYKSGGAGSEKTPPHLISSKEKDEKEVEKRILSVRPFGGGITLCPGRHFATREIVGSLAVFMQMLEMEVVEEELQKNGMPVPDLSRQAAVLPDRKFVIRVRRRR